MADQRARKVDGSPEGVASPCIGVCRLDAAGVCDGCGRSGDEIGLWRDADDDLRRVILVRAARRRQGR